MTVQNWGIQVDSEILENFRESWGRFLFKWTRWSRKEKFILHPWPEERLAAIIRDKSRMLSLISKTRIFLGDPFVFLKVSFK